MVSGVRADFENACVPGCGGVVGVEGTVEGDVGVEVEGGCGGGGVRDCGLGGGM